MNRRDVVSRLAAFLLVPFIKAQGQSFASSLELAISFEIINPGGFRYAKPYVAVWVEDKSGKPVRTVALWVQTGKGARWIPDLRRWYGNVGNANSLISTVSAPTRMPGKYNLVWDGKDDNGRVVAQGGYFVCIEMAREHGPYSLFRESVELGSSAFGKRYNNSGELGGIAIELRKKA